ncbi:MAG: hypothetical protein ACE37M_14995 [Henriciella sp.]
MKPMISSLSALMALTVFAAPMASAQSCAKQAASLQEKQAEAQSLAEARLTLVDEVEAAGDAWENAEAMRNFGEAQAIEADTTKTAYDTLKADLFEKESSLQLLVANLNKDVQTYNQRCVTD